MATMYKVKFTADEAEYLKTFVSREVMRINRLPPKERATKENVSATKLEVSEEMELNRVEVKLISKLINNFVLITRTMTLPEYDRRLQQHPEFAVKYQPYIEKTEAELTLCEQLREKIEGLL